MRPEDVATLRCPETGAKLRWFGGLDAAGHLARGRLDATVTGSDAAQASATQAGASPVPGPSWPVFDGLPWLFREAEVSRRDRFMRAIYDRVPAWHDPAVKVLLPLFQHHRETEHTLREACLDRLDLHALPTDRPARILEVSVGTGANLPRLRARLAPGQPVELWGLDLSPGMVAVGRRKGRLAAVGPDGRPESGVRVVLGDAHRLPFATGAFDRVFHVGGINGFGDPGRALAELARVARPGTPIVVVDEQLDAGRRANLWHRLTFKAVTFYDRDPRAPVDRLPPGAVVLANEQPSRFFYSLTFAMPAR